MSTKPKPIEIDILQTELDQNLPYWLDPVARHADTPAKQAIRQKHRDKYLEQKKQNTPPSK
ncbi:MAG TPA: hypothetical protein VGH47_08070 [Xanthobacteraceae bacterium]|jgi:hypothetical protein